LDLTSTANFNGDTTQFDYPLTLRTEVDASWTNYCKVTQGNQIRIYPVIGGIVQHTVGIPGRGEIRLEESSSMDTTPPVAPAVVKDGTTADIDSTNKENQISANWDEAIDGETGIAEYFYKIGTTPEGAEVVDWMTTSTWTFVTVYRDGLTLTDGLTYYFTVKAVNGVGLESEVTSSNGQCYIKPADTTPPSDISWVNDGTTGSDIDSAFSTSELSANWAASSDPESSIAKYWYAIGTTPGGTDTAGWTEGTATSVTRTGLSLSMGTVYYFTVKAENGEGLQSLSATNSDGQEVETSVDKPFPNLKVYPNPLILSEGGQITFSVGAAAGGEIKIYTISGKLVKKLEIGAGETFWSGENKEGETIAQGIYIYVLTDEAGNSRTGKLNIVR
jgi:hypothetical protein